MPVGEAVASISVAGSNPATSSSPTIDESGQSITNGGGNSVERRQGNVIECHAMPNSAAGLAAHLQLDQRDTHSRIRY
jgi:hypothetical protein